MFSGSKYFFSASIFVSFSRFGTRNETLVLAHREIFLADIALKLYLMPFYCLAAHNPQINSNNSEHFVADVDIIFIGNCIWKDLSM